MADTSAKGAQLSVSDMASSPTFTAIANISAGPDGPGFTQSFIEAVTHSATQRLRKKTFTDIGPVTFEVLYDSSNTQHAQLRDASKAGTLLDFRATSTDTGAEVAAFSAWVDFNVGRDPNGFNTAQITLTLDGATGVTYT